MERVRNNADIMPYSQTEQMLRDNIGADWKTQFQEFDLKPFASASIGQVHRATTKEGVDVAVKIQYPGVADSIESDMDNLFTLLSYSGMLPAGMYLDKTLKVTKKELLQETDYFYEKDNQMKFRQFLQKYPEYYVPFVVDELTTKQVLTTEFVRGVNIDKLNESYDQVTRNWVAYQVMRLTLLELFEFRFMQTDPNWANFIWNSETRKLNLIDFGACSNYSEQFLSEYLNVIASAARKDRKGIDDASLKLGFFTGQESEIMKNAHINSVLILGEPFMSTEPYDFSQQNITKRIHELIPTMLKYRLTPPPQETYALHRKLSGAFLICAKLKAVIPLHDLFWEIHDNFQKSVKDKNNKQSE
eukprot:TRINITY_DN6955_c0_g1_i3.p1 TRINITY_DN6955_c0_g1~~TRINITY_DN6955_c0_g1_i3.p1  ORF type:complete len:359 (+),score=78.04 TRINITY_DN6955_c0_g1_i3:111-1187(+)